MRVLAPAGWFSWLECPPHKRKDFSLDFPVQSTYLSFGFDPSPGAYGRQLIDVS